MTHLDPADYDDSPTWGGQPAQPDRSPRSGDGQPPSPPRPVYRYAEDDYGNLYPDASGYTSPPAERYGTGSAAPGQPGGWSEVWADSSGTGSPVTMSRPPRPVSGAPDVTGDPLAGGQVERGRA